ncbi:homoserine O-succinyltransferase [Amphibacillus marinus]|uniref:Homoserine O-acetyltransferase n=1 Tax=Amphibacillus marinus TaxID=872970 RepID=A0A1H8IH44_9BACI|nr:homoserine O-succinyltransferase [Amphibacillus marinus]SEN67565.1 homoserine O-succinyltransferase [Amphibacillus marinus]
MPINIPKGLPARTILERENIFLMDKDRASAQDIRPLKILILNLMPEKERTETQLLRLLSNSALQISIDFIHTESYQSRNVPKSHLEQFYLTFSDVKQKHYDGLIITGAPVEQMHFEQVDYWPEMVEIMDWADQHVTSTLHICWGAQAALYHHFQVDKFDRSNKISGVYSHQLIEPTNKLVRGINDLFFAPHSRYTDTDFQAIEHHPELFILDHSEQAGPLLIASRNKKHVMITGHIEYDANTLAEEYQRDLAKGLNVNMPENYYPNENINNTPLNRWRSSAYLLFSNWLNYYVYQVTPYNL